MWHHHAPTAVFRGDSLRTPRHHLRSAARGQMHAGLVVSRGLTDYDLARLNDRTEMRDRPVMRHRLRVLAIGAAGIAAPAGSAGRFDAGTIGQAEIFPAVEPLAQRRVAMGWGGVTAITPEALVAMEQRLVRPVADHVVLAATVAAVRRVVDPFVDVPLAAAAVAGVATGMAENQGATVATTALRTAGRGADASLGHKN